MGPHPAASGVAEPLSLPGFEDRLAGDTREMDSQDRSAPHLVPNLQMAWEARRIVDKARERGVTLRLLGGFAVHEHCGEFGACLRSHTDVDMVGLSRQMGAVVALFRESGFLERVHVRQASRLGQAQFVRRCIHTDAEGVRTHDEDHVDIFFDRFKMDHQIDLRARLDLHPYAIAMSDVLATKLQMHAPEARDVQDSVMLFAVARGPGAGAADIDAGYLAALCAKDWGLFFDVTRSLQRCAEALGDAGLTTAERERAAGLVTGLTGEIDAAPKSLGWRVRARVGTRRRWYDIVEEQMDLAS